MENFSHEMILLYFHRQNKVSIPKIFIRYWDFCLILGIRTGKLGLGAGAGLLAVKSAAAGEQITYGKTAAAYQSG